ncbi:MAG: hypothetical protein QME42_08600 [bacterium]|nr:hypothetical protein [bacterium]
MKCKLLISLFFILGVTCSAKAEENRSHGDSLYSSQLPSRKFYSSQAKKGRIPVGKSMYYNGLLYNRGTATLSGGETRTTTSYNPPKNLKQKTSSQPGTSSARPETFSSRPWLGQSLYKKLSEKDEQEDKSQSYYLPKPEKKNEDRNYYSNIFYQGSKPQTELTDEEVNPFLMRK